MLVVIIVVGVILSYYRDYTGDLCFGELREPVTTRKPQRKYIYLGLSDYLVLKKNMLLERMYLFDYRPFILKVSLIRLNSL